MRIIYPRKTSRGLHCTLRSRRTLKRGGYVPLLLSKDLGSGDTRLSVERDVNSDNNIVGGTVSNEILKRIGGKLKNIRF